MIIVLTQYDVERRLLDKRGLAEVEQHADAIVVGEGEPSWPTVLADLEHGRLQPRYQTSRWRQVSSEEDTGT